MADDGLLEGFSDAAPMITATAAAAPRERGVHVLTDPEGSIVYVGKTSNLRDRLQQHLTGDRTGSVLREQVGTLLDGDGGAASAGQITAWINRCAVSWRVVEDADALKGQLVSALSPRFNRMTEAPPTGVWWVNQGRSYDQERDLGVLFAGAAPPLVAHHLNVSRVKPGDIVLHHRRGSLMAIGEVVSNPVSAIRPHGSTDDRNDGWLARVEYFPLDVPITVASLPDRQGDEGPFNVNGGLKQGYLYPLDTCFAALIRSTNGPWPPGSPWADNERRHWLFQSNPKQWDLEAHLPGMPPGWVEDWTVSRYRDEMQIGDAVALWQAGPHAAIYVLGHLVGSPELRPTPEFRPESVGADEYRAQVVVDRHVVPAITRAQAKAHPVLSGLEVLTRPWSGTNFRLTRDQWRAVLGEVSIDSDSKPAVWQPIVHWAARFAESIDFDREEREYKLELRDRVSSARTAVTSGDPGWPDSLRRVFGPPNNLTAWQMHAKFADWVDAHHEEAREALLVLWDDERDIVGAVDGFATALPSEVPGPGTRANLASFLLAARGVEQHPVFRVTVFEKAFRLTGWEHIVDGSPGERYAEALTFLDVFREQCRLRGVIPTRDRLDAQGLLWRVLSGERLPDWSDSEFNAYKRFLDGDTVDPLAELVDQFRRETAYPEHGRPEREQERVELAAALSPDALEDPDARLLRRLAGSAYGSPGPQPGFNRHLQTDEGIGRVTAWLRFVLYGAGPENDRLDSCINGEHKLPGVGEAMAVKALAVRSPDRWVPCFVTTGKVGKLTILELLGEEFSPGGSAGERAATSNDLLRQLLEPHLGDDAWGMQEFSWWVLHRERVPEATLRALADELFLTEEFLVRVGRLLEDKGQVVFYGPPGTGKTYVARKMAGHIARGGGTIEKVQFHPSYAYEDFVEGYRPIASPAGQVTYKIVDGPLKRLAATARERPDVTHVLLIDELNRANVSKVLGELLYLLEYRDEEIRLQYSDEPFSLPANLQIIATMNTADRSIALVDTALRRRFHFMPFFPDEAPINQVLPRWLAANHPELGWVADVLRRANAALADRNLAIGPSHFMRSRLTEELVNLAWDSSVLPFLEEHFFGDPSQLARFAIDRLRGRTPEEQTADVAAGIVGSESLLQGPADE